MRSHSDFDDHEGESPTATEAEANIPHSLEEESPAGSPDDGLPLQTKLESPVEMTDHLQQESPTPEKITLTSSCITIK